MEVIVLQHINIEDPGYIKDLMIAVGFQLTTVELDEGQKIPENLSKFDGITMIGGVSLNGKQIFEEAKHDLDHLETKIRSTYEVNPDFLIG